MTVCTWEYEMIVEDKKCGNIHQLTNQARESNGRTKKSSVDQGSGKRQEQFDCKFHRMMRTIKTGFRCLNPLEIGDIGINSQYYTI